jgi:hypothetical protein
VGQFGRLNLALMIDQHVENPIAAFTDKVLMALHQWIEML